MEIQMLPRSANHQFREKAKVFRIKNQARSHLPTKLIELREVLYANWFVKASKSEKSYGSKVQP